MQPLTTKTPGFLANAGTVMARIEFAGIVIDEMRLHSTSTPDVLEGVSQRWWIFETRFYTSDTL